LNQERELREIAGRMGCEIVKVYRRATEDHHTPAAFYELPLSSLAENAHELVPRDL
jgi:hypothetical protein